MIEVSDKSEHPDASDRNHSAYKLGVEHHKATNIYLAAQAFSEALEYWPEDPQAWFALGVCYDDLEKPRKAEKYFRKALEYSPAAKLPDVHYNLGNSLYDQNQFSEAIDLYRKIPSGHPIYEKAQINLKLSENHEAEQVGARQPATAPDSKSEGIEKTKPESEGRSQ